MLEKGFRGNLGGQDGRGRGRGLNGHRPNPPGRGSGGVRSDLTCFKCGSKGHFAAQCSNPLAMPADVRTLPVCFKCGKIGHIARFCAAPPDDGNATRTLLDNDTSIDKGTVMATAIVQDCLQYVLTIQDRLSEPLGDVLGEPKPELGVLAQSAQEITSAELQGLNRPSTDRLISK